MFKFLPLISIKDITDAIFGAVVEPVAKAVSSVVSTVLGIVINDVLSPALKVLFNSVVEPILGLIGDVLLAWLHIRTYYLYVAILRVIDVLEYAFNIFGGVSKVNVTNGESDFLLNIFFNNSAVSYVFWGITLLAFAVSLVFGIISVIKSSADLDGKRPVGKVLGSIAKTGLTFLIVPFFMTFALNMTNVVIKKTNEILSMSMGEETPSLGTVLFLATTLQAEENSAGEMSNAQLAEALKKDNDNDMVGFTDGVRAKYYSGERKYWNFADVSSDFNIAQIQTLLGAFMSVFIALMLIICTFVFITRIFEVMLLYIASPFFVATIPLDDGAKFEEWKNMFIAKLFSGFGMLIGMKLYILLVPIIMSSNLELSSVNFVNMGLKILFILGGAFAIYKSNSLLMQILNVQASYGEAATAHAGMGFIMSAKNKGMNALKGSMSKNSSKGGASKALPTTPQEGNKNPNLNSFNRVSVSPGVTRNGKIVIGSHRAKNSRSNIEIGSHRAKPANETKWKSATPSSEKRNSNITIGASEGRKAAWENSKTRISGSQSSDSKSNSTTWKSATPSQTKTVERSTTSAQSNNTWKSATPSQTKTAERSATSTQSNNTWKSATPSQTKTVERSTTSTQSNNTWKSATPSQTKTTEKSTTSTQNNTTWKKATPRNRNDEGSKF